MYHQLLLLIATFSLWSCGHSIGPGGPASGNESTNRSERDHVGPRASTSIPAGLYYGASKGESETRAWILRFDTSRALLYMPPDNLVISDVKVDPESNVSFVSEPGLGGVVYRFVGKIANNEIVGTFTYSPNPSYKTDERKAEVSLKRIVERSAGPGAVGLFTNVKYVEESGDLVGAEIVLLGDVGTLVSYDSELIPLASSVSEIKPGRTRIELQTRHGKAIIDAKVSSKTVEVLRSQPDDLLSLSGAVLRRRKSISEFLR